MVLTESNGHHVVAPCNGLVKYVVDKDMMVVTASFINIQRCALCGQCEFDTWCTKILVDQQAPATPPNAKTPPKTPQKASQTPKTEPAHTPDEAEQNPLTPTLIQVRAFTGMPIGDMLIIKAGKKYIEVTTKKGQMIRFNRQSGLQTNCVNPKFANRVDPATIPAWIPFYQPFTNQQAATN